MSKFTLCRMACGMLAIAFLAPPLAGAPPYPQDRSFGFTRHHTWSSNGETAAEGLLVYQGSPSGILARMLIKSPDGHRLILTKQTAALHGWDRLVLRDDATGWWFELLETNGIEAGGLQEYLHRALDWYDPEKDRHIVLRARSRGGIDFSRTIPIESTLTDAYLDFANAFRTEGPVEDLRAEMPDDLANALAFLGVAFEGADMRGVIDVLAVLGIDQEARDAAAGVEWQEKEEMGKNGAIVADRNDLELSTEFGSIDARDPLSDQTPEVLATDAPPPPSGR